MCIYVYNVWRIIYTPCRPCAQLLCCGTVASPSPERNGFVLSPFGFVAHTPLCVRVYAVRVREATLFLGRATTLVRRASSSSYTAPVAAGDPVGEEEEGRGTRETVEARVFRGYNVFLRALPLDTRAARDSPAAAQTTLVICANSPSFNSYTQQDRTRGPHPRVV